jgi:ribose transport system ATP-binding protein
MDEPYRAPCPDRETARLFRHHRAGCVIEPRPRSSTSRTASAESASRSGDRITVLRDGRKIASVSARRNSPDDLVRLMVGRAVDRTYAREYWQDPGRLLLDVKGLASDNGIADISLAVRAGEIVGLCGLVGSGRTEVARAIFGADRVTAGEIRLKGESLAGSPEDSARRGMALIPENRKQQGLALGRSVGDNIVLASLHKMFPSGIFRPSRAARAARAGIEQLRIATPSPNRPVSVLSGGNQQKVVVAKWLAADRARVHLRRTDARHRCRRQGGDVPPDRSLVQKGAGVLMISSEQTEIVHVCDRAYVMRAGRIVGELARATS